jgi:outer membrane receptor protein involved in Fe transport
LSLPWGDQVLGLTYKKKDARGGWFLLDLGLSYQLNKHSRLFFKASNLLDKRYQEIAGVPQPGRWVEGGLGLEW